MELFEKYKAKFNAKSLELAANKPRYWAFGWLTQFVIAGILLGFSLLVALLLPNSTIDTLDVEVWYAFGFVPAAFWWIFMGYRMVKYNPDKLFGNRTVWDNYKEWPSYILQFMLPLIIPYSLGIVAMMRNASLLSYEEIEEYRLVLEEADPFYPFDINGSYYNNSYSSGDYYNGHLHYFENDLAFQTYVESDYNGNNASRWEREQYEIEKTKRNVKSKAIRAHEGVYSTERPLLYPLSFNAHSSLFKKKHFPKNEDLYPDTDSLKQLYFLKYNQDYDYVLEKFTAYENALVEFGFDKKGIVSADRVLKYYKNHTYYYPEMSFEANEVEILQDLTDDYLDQLNYIKKCKDVRFRIFYKWQGYVFIVIFISLFALVFILFKNMAWQEFLFSLFVIVSIGVVSGVLLAIFRADEEVVIGYFWLLFIALLIWNRKEKALTVRRKRGAFLLTVRHLGLIVVPLFILLTLDELFHFWRWDMFDFFKEPCKAAYNYDKMCYNEAYYTTKKAAPWVVWWGTYIVYMVYMYPRVIKRDWIDFISKPRVS